MDLRRVFRRDTHRARLPRPVRELPSHPSAHLTPPLPDRYAFGTIRYAFGTTWYAFGPPVTTTIVADANEVNRVKNTPADSAAVDIAAI
jgi:hypothetical protein